MKEKRIEIYGRESCRFCAAAVACCTIRNYPFVFRDIDDPAVHDQLAQRGSRGELPQIFIGAHRIGGLEALRANTALIHQILGGH